MWSFLSRYYSLSVLAYFIIAAFVALFIFLIIQDRKPFTLTDQASFTLSYGLVAKGLSLLCFLFFWGPLLYNLAHEYRSNTAGWLCWIGWAGFFGWQVVESFGRRTKVDGLGLASHHWYRQPVRVAWSEVTRVSFSSFTNYLVIHGARGEKVRLSRHQRGIPELIQVLTEKLPQPLWADAIAKARL